MKKINLFITVFYLQISKTFALFDGYKPKNIGGLTNKNDFLEKRPSSVVVHFLEIFSGALISIAAPIAVVMIIISGFMLVINSGESEKKDEALNMLKWSVIGLVIVILSWSLVRIFLGAITALA